MRTDQQQAKGGSITSWNERLPLVLNKQAKRHLHSLLLALSVLGAMAYLFAQGNFERLEWQVDDLKTQLLREDSQAPEEILILLIDEASLSAMDPVVGRWPWPRSVWGDLLEFLAMTGAQSVIFDILFTERDASLGGGAHDQILTDMTEATGLATHAMQLLYDEHNPHADRPLPDFYPDRFALDQVTGVDAGQHNTYYIPYQGLDAASQQLAVVEFAPDADGTYRRSRLLRAYQGHYYPALSLAPLRSKAPWESTHQSNRSLFLDQLRIPLGRDGLYRVNFYEHFESISLASVFASIEAVRRGDIEALYTDPELVEPELFEDKIIFIGASAVGLEDLKDTPIHNRWPGVYLHASITGNLLTEDFLYQVDVGWVYLLMVFAALSTALIVVVSAHLSIQLGLPLVLVSIYIATSFWLQARFGLLLDIVPVVATLLSTWLLISAYLSATEGRERRRVRNMLSQYVSPAALNTVLDNYKEDQLAAEVGQEVNMSVAFSDIRSFTTICEGLSATQVVELLNIHLDAMTQVTFDYKGTMDKFIGDATMAFWGAPLPDEDHAYHATLAAINMDRAMDEVNQKITERGMQPIAVGIGVNTGPVVLGNIGSSQKLDYTIIGDAVNLGSRMEGLTKGYGVPVLISEFTFEALGRRIPSALVDAVRVKGKQKPVKIYAPLVEPIKEAEELEWGWEMALRTEEAFHLYQQQRFSEALEAFKSLPDVPFNKYKVLMQERCQLYLETPPPSDWDGVFTLQTK